MEDILRRGDLSRETLVWTEGLGGWTPLGSLGDLDPVQQLFVTCGPHDAVPAAVRYLEDFAEKLEQDALRKKMKQQAAAGAMLRREEMYARAEQRRLAEELERAEAIRTETEERLFSTQTSLAAAGDEAEALHRDREALEQALREGEEAAQREKEAVAERIAKRQARIQELESELREARRAESDAVAAIAVKAAEPPPPIIPGRPIGAKWVPVVWAAWGALVLLVGGYILYRLGKAAPLPETVPAAAPAVPVRKAPAPAPAVRPPKAAARAIERRVVPIPPPAPTKSRVRRKGGARAAPKPVRKRRVRSASKPGPRPGSDAVPLHMLPGISGAPPLPDAASAGP